MPDDVATGSYKYLLQFSDLTSLLGSFPGNDPVAANAGQPWLFAGDILVNMKGSSAAAVVLSDAGGFGAPPMYGTQRFRRLRADIWQDPHRDAAGGVTETSALTTNRANYLFLVLQHHLHRRDPDTVQWGDLVTFGCQLLTEPEFISVPDGDWLQRGTAFYGVYLGGWADLASLGGPSRGSASDVSGSCLLRESGCLCWLRESA